MHQFSCVATGSRCAAGGPKNLQKGSAPPYQRLLWKTARRSVKGNTAMAMLRPARSADAPPQQQVGTRRGDVSPRAAPPACGVAGVDITKWPIWGSNNWSCHTSQRNY
jgi:hypothetical protein